MTTAQPDPNLQASFERDARDPASWAFEADALRDSAAILWERHRADFGAFHEQFSRGVPLRDIPESDPPSSFAFRPALMLAGLALENLLKGLLVLRDPSLVHTASLDSRLTSHRLLALLEDAGIPLLPEERGWAQRAQEVVVWAGRYPFPKRRETLTSGHFLPATDKEVFEVLYDKVYCAFRR